LKDFLVVDSPAAAFSENTNLFSCGLAVIICTSSFSPISFCSCEVTKDLSPPATFG